MSLLTFLAQIDKKDLPNLPRVETDAVTLHAILNTVYFWAGIVAVLIIVVAGFLYVLSRGDASKVKTAKDAILGAIIGLAVVLLAFTITQFVIGQAQTSGGGGGGGSGSCTRACPAP